MRPADRRTKPRYIVLLICSGVTLTLAGLHARLADRWTGPPDLRQHGSHPCGIACGRLVVGHGHSLVLLICTGPLMRSDGSDDEPHHIMEDSRMTNCVGVRYRALRTLIVTGCAGATSALLQ